MSYDEVTKQFTWKPVTQVIQTPSASIPKLRITLENGQAILCTSNHKWLTENRGWVEAGHLTLEDDLVAPKCVIYKITNQTNGKAYVGYTSQTIEKRFKEHLNESAYWGDERYASHFHRAIHKYGPNCWTREAIDWAYSLEEAKQKERSWISQLDTKANGYNSTDGGDGANGYRWTDEHRARASENAYVRTPEHIEDQRKVLATAQDKINATRKTQAYRDKQRERNTGLLNPMSGYQYTDEQRQVKQEQAKTRVRQANGRFS